MAGNGKVMGNVVRAMGGIVKKEHFASAVAFLGVQMQAEIEGRRVEAEGELQTYRIEPLRDDIARFVYLARQQPVSGQRLKQKGEGERRRRGYPQRSRNNSMKSVSGAQGGVLKG